MNNHNRYEFKMHFKKKIHMLNLIYANFLVKLKTEIERQERVKCLWNDLILQVRYRKDRSWFKCRRNS